jgi:hypothetical protein
MSVSWCSEAAQAAVDAVEYHTPEKVLKDANTLLFFQSTMGR